MSTARRPTPTPGVPEIPERHGHPRRRRADRRAVDPSRIRRSAARRAAGAANAVVTEYFDRVNESGSEYLIVHTTVDDQRYLNNAFITSSHFKREPDASKFTPVACE
jgi:hypothetical protein